MRPVVSRCSGRARGDWIRECVASRLRSWFAGGLSPCRLSLGVDSGSLKDRVDAAVLVGAGMGLMGSFVVHDDLVG